MKFMEDRILNNSESLELISSMIKNTQEKITKNSGTPFLIWGYTTIIISRLVWGVSKDTLCGWSQALWFALPIIAFPLTLLSQRKKKVYVKTFVDSVISKIWIIFGVAGFIVTILAFLSPVLGVTSMPILFSVLLLMAMGTALTGLVIKFNILTICGIVSMFLSSACLIYRGLDSILVFSAIFFIMMVIPGHILNSKANKNV